jgi:sulfite dehydrogenase (cytochrome) subunit A
MKRREFLAGALLTMPIASAGHAAAGGLSGGGALIRRSWRPPNLETPLEGLRHLYTPNDQFFVRYHLSVIPEVDTATWRLRIGGESVTTPFELSLPEMRRRYAQVEIPAINQCSGNRRGLFEPRVPGVQWSNGAMGNARWRGVRLRDVLRDAGVRSDAMEVVFDGADRGVIPQTPDFQKSLPVEKALHEDVLVAFGMNGKPLPHSNGAPARLVVPGWTATYWVKHLSEIRVQPKAFDGFWMKSGYRVPAGAFAGERFVSQETAETVPITEILVNSLITSHADGDSIRRGRVAELGGWAWDGGSGIANVEVSADGGRLWKAAALGRDVGRYSWREFRWPIETRAAGRIELRVRATARSGATQPDLLVANPSGYHHNRVQRVALEVFG